MAHNEQIDNKQRPKLNLPFVRRRTSVPVWVYKHRHAICVTLIGYLLFGIVFMTVKVVIHKKTAVQEIIVDLTDLEKLQQELERAQELNRVLNERYDSSTADNSISNEYAEERRDNPNRSNAKDLYEEADRVQKRVRQNASDYQQGLDEERAIRDRRRAGDQAESRRVKGKVTVSYSLSDPLRHARIMPVPSYMCEGGGQVVVNITVNRNGQVVAAEIDASESESNHCLRSAALEKARISLFNADASAPDRQKGTITYQFVPQ